MALGQRGRKRLYKLHESRHEAAVGSTERGRRRISPMGCQSPSDFSGERTGDVCKSRTSAIPSFSSDRRGYETLGCPRPGLSAHVRGDFSVTSILASIVQSFRAPRVSGSDLRRESCFRGNGGAERSRGKEIQAEGRGGLLLQGSKCDVALDPRTRQLLSLPANDEPFSPSPKPKQ